MDKSEIERIIANLDGHLRAFAMINSTYFDYTSSASMVTLDGSNLLGSLSNLLNSHVDEMSEYFEDIDFTKYSLESLETITPWLDPFEKDLKDLLLPNPFKQSEKIDNEILETVKCQVSWYVMEIIRTLTNEFANKEIHIVNYKKEDNSTGYCYIIPISSNYLLLNFCKNNIENEG